MNNFTIVFIHGFTASSRVNWYPRIAKLINERNIEFRIPDLPPGPNGKVANADVWLDILHKTIETIKTPLMLVGQSLGTRAALLYLEKYQPKNVEKVFLIAAFANRTENAQRNQGKAYPTFFKHEIDIAKIKPLAKQFIVVHSQDDDSIAYEQGVEIAKDLDAKLITFDHYGHVFQPELAPVIFDLLLNEISIE